MTGNPIDPHFCMAVSHQSQARAAPSITPATATTIYTCPMRPQIRQAGPGSWMTAHRKAGLHSASPDSRRGSSSSKPWRTSATAGAEVGLRLRCEFRLEIAPYVGVSWAKKFGHTADLARTAGEHDDELSLVAGIRLWF